MNTVSDPDFFFWNMSLNCSSFQFLFNDTNCTFNGPFEERFFFQPPDWLAHVIRLLYAFVGLFGLAGNTLVIYVVLRYSKMQTVTNMYILNLAFADEMYLIGLPFLLTTMIYSYWPFGRVMCKIYMTTTSINQFTSSLLLTVMSADRYMAVCHPIQSPRFRTPFIAKFICLTAWTLSALLMVPIYMYASTLDRGTDGGQVNCNIYWPENAYLDGEVTFALYAFILGFALPLLLILLFYFLVICKLRHVGPKSKKKKTHRKVTYLVLSVITVYVLCWLPYWCAQMWLTFLPPTASGQNLLTFSMMLVTNWLAYTNSAVNPILYAFLSDNFKKSFAKAFTCASRQEVNAQLQVENSFFPKSKGQTKTSRPESPLALKTEATEPSTAVTSAREPSTQRNGYNNVDVTTV